MARVDPKLVYSGTRLLWLALLSALLGWIGVCVGLFTDRTATFFGYLTAFAFVTSTALGALILLMTTYLVGARWNVALRRLNEAMVSVFPVLAVLFVPLLFGLSELYVWMAPSPDFSEHQRQLLEHKQTYLNAPFFAARSVVYFAVWSAAAVLLCRWSLARDRNQPAPAQPAESVHTRERVLSAALLPFVALTLTFAAFDWLMSLQPFWISTLFGVYFFAGGFVASFGVLSLLAFFAQRSGMVEGIIQPSHFHALGRLMFAFTIFWAYNAYFQAMLIQMANRPEEVEFYVHRLEHGWDKVLIVVIIWRFAVPFALLLSRGIKFKAGAMAGIGGLLLAGHYADVLWLVAPAHAEHGPFANLWDVSALLAVAGTTVAFAALKLRGNPLVPVGDPALDYSIQYRSPT